MSSSFLTFLASSPFCSAGLGNRWGVPPTRSLYLLHIYCGFITKEFFTSIEGSFCVSLGSLLLGGGLLGSFFLFGRLSLFLRCGGGGGTFRGSFFFWLCVLAARVFFFGAFLGVWLFFLLVGVVGVFLFVSWLLGLFGWWLGFFPSPLWGWGFWGVFFRVFPGGGWVFCFFLRV